MKGKIKNILSKKIFYVILGILLVGIVEIVYASNLINSKNVSYSNSSSKLNSSNVQGAIDELYKNCKDVKEECPDNNLCINAPAASKLIKKVVTSGDGLYQDEIESNKYFYRGKNPNNWINFNNELWRILNINQDGTIKIIKNDIYSNEMISWDESNNNDWSRPSSLNNELNSTYYNSLSTTAKNMINSSVWDIGAVKWENNHSLKETIAEEKITTWTGKIALFTISEYIRTSSNSKCFTGPYDYQHNTNGTPGYSVCKETTWLYDATHLYSLTAMKDSEEVLILYIDANGYPNMTRSDNPSYLKPTLNLKSSIQITGGIGSSTDPYQITSS